MIHAKESYERQALVLVLHMYIYSYLFDCKSFTTLLTKELIALTRFISPAEEFVSLEISLHNKMHSEFIF